MDTQSTKTEAEASMYNTAAFTALFNNGLERVVEASKASLDAAREQNAEVLTSCKKVLKASSLPGLFVFDLAGQAFEGYVTLQKNLLDLAVEQSTSMMNAAQEYSQDASKAKGINTLIQQSVDRTVAAQNSVLDFAAKQAKAAGESVKQQPGVTGTAVETVTEAVQRGMDNVIAAQKEIVNLAAKPVKTTTVKA